MSRLRWLIIAGICVFLSPAISYSQSELKRLYERNQIEELQDRLSQNDWGNSSEISIQFIEAIFEKNGENAVTSLKKLVQENPNSQEIPALIERIALYQFASGLYNTAREKFLYLDKRYSKSKYGEQALYYVSRCWQAIGKADSAKSTMKEFHRKYPGSRFNEISGLSLNQDKISIKTTNINRSNSRPIYSIQTGAFSKNTNARIQKQFFENKGLQADIYIKFVNNKKYYVVCVGKFDSIKEAEKRGMFVDKKYKTKYQLVDLTLLEAIQ